MMAVLFSWVDPQWQFGRGSSKKHFCEILLKSAYWPWSRCCSTFLFFALVEQNHFSKTGRGSSKEHSGEIILKLAYWPKRCHLKGFSIFSSDGHFVQRSGTILAILVEGHPKNISTKLCWNQPIGLGADVILQVFLFLALAATLFSRVEQFEQCFSKEHFCATILKSANWPWRRCRFMSFLFLALVAILFSGAEPF